MPDARQKSTSVRALKIVMAMLERTAPSVGARWVDRRWFAVSARRPVNGDMPPGGTPFELSVDGATVRGRRWGRNDEIVYLVHGWGSSGVQLRAFVEPLLEAGFSVVAYDALSHGRSDPGSWGPGRSNALEQRDVLTAVVAAHGPAYGVVAHSLGSMVAALALRHGVVPRRAVYVAPMVDVVSYGRPFLRMLGAGERIWTRFVDRVERRFGHELSYFDIGAIADELATPPLLIVHDRADQETRWEDSRALARTWPHTRLLTTSGLGHNRILADPGVVMAAVAFLHDVDAVADDRNSAAVATAVE
jgi:pimeloyl-ACP methyl ester carboxylesterase